MVKEISTQQATYSTRKRTLLALTASGLLMIGITFVLYTFTENLLKDRLFERILAIAKTAETQINPEDVVAVKTIEDIDSPSAKRLAGQLVKIRDANPDARFVYILRKTSDPNVLEFVMDAESLDTKEEQELRAGEALEEDELAPLPGDPYEVDEDPVLRDEAFLYATTQKELLTDQWSQQISSYAPIFDESGEVVAVLGIDVVVDDYLARIREAFFPFVLFVLFLVFLLTFLTLVLIRLWGERVKILQDLDRQKDELLGIVAHQLAKPITAIRWDLESLLDGDLGELNAEQKSEAQMMKVQAIGLADLVSMILDVSRIQLGRIQFEPRPLDLNELFKEMLDVIKPTIAEKKIDFIKKMPANLPTVLLDKRYTRMTIENLLTNAVKYTPDGGKVTLDVTIENGVMHCKVSDTGCGIPKTDQGKIFGKMYRASNVVNSVDGNGFGLYVAKGAVEGQGGSIGFESVEGKGTTFFFTLPMKEAPKKE